MPSHTYSESLAWLYGTQQRGIKLGLENIRRLLKALDFSESDHCIVHVAGTNGKGSVCALLESICRTGGKRTGLFTSPHLVCFRERIRVSGEMIAEHEVTEGLKRIRSVIGNWENEPTFFEITTALALDYFHRHRVEIIVLETGLGGRLDSTNAVMPDVCVLTSIALDHQAWLGNSIMEIAAEKAGIIKPGIPVVSLPQTPEAEQVIEETAELLNAPLTFVREPLFDYAIGLSGIHQRWNAALTTKALHAIGLRFDGETLRTGLRDVSWPGRFQVVADRFILDGAHNPAAAFQLCHTWHENFGDETATLILGTLADKDPEAMIRALLPIASQIIAVPVNSLRTCPPETLQEIANSIDPDIPCTVAPSVRSALSVLPEGRVLIAGSLFLVGEALAHLTGASPPHPSVQ